MYIPEFWCGVIATIGIEFVVLVGYGIWQNLKGKNNGKEEK